MDQLNIEILAALRQQTIATKELSQSVNNLALEIEQPIDYVKVQNNPWINRNR
jgi:hypothetical protein